MRNSFDARQRPSTICETRLKTTATFLRLALAASCTLGSTSLVHAQPAGGENNRPKTLEDYKRFALSQQADAARGQALFFDQNRLACSKCHTVDGKNGKPGPDLFAIGDKYARPDLIEAVLQPSANIAVGYGTTIITTKSGDDYT